MFINWKQLGCHLIIFAVLFAVLSFPSLIPQPDSQSQLIMEQNNARAQSATVASIYNNNLVIALCTLIPVGGWIFIGVVLWSTGVVVASYANPVATLLFNPFVYVELAVYSYVVLQSIRILRLFRRRKTRFTDLEGKQVVRNTVGVWYEIGKTVAYVLIVCAVTLLVSALIEYSLVAGALG